MVYIWECELIFSCFEISITIGFLFLSCVSEINEMPIFDFFTVFKWLINIRIAISIQIIIGISSKCVNSFRTDPDCQISITKLFCIIINFLIIDSNSKSKMPRFLSSRYPFKPTSDGVLFWERVIRITYCFENFSSVSSCFKFLFNNLLKSSFLAILQRNWITLNSILLNLSSIIKEWSLSNFHNWSSELTIKSRILI